MIAQEKLGPPTLAPTTLLRPLLGFRVVGGFLRASLGFWAC